MANIPRIPPQGFWASLQSSQAKALLWWASSDTWRKRQRHKLQMLCFHGNIPRASFLNEVKQHGQKYADIQTQAWCWWWYLDASGVGGLGLRVGAGLQGFVEMVDGLAGGVPHRHQTVVGHPAAVKRLNLWVGWKEVKEKWNQENYRDAEMKQKRSSAHLQTPGCTPGSWGAPGSLQRPGAGPGPEGPGAGRYHPVGWMGWSGLMVERCCCCDLHSEALWVKNLNIIVKLWREFKLFPQTFTVLFHFVLVMCLYSLCFHVLFWNEIPSVPVLLSLH